MRRAGPQLGPHGRLSWSTCSSHPAPGDVSNTAEKWNHLLVLVLGQFPQPHLSLRFSPAWTSWAHSCPSFRAMLTPTPREAPVSHLLPVLSEPHCTCCAPFLVCLPLLAVCPFTATPGGFCSVLPLPGVNVPSCPGLLFTSLLHVSPTQL